MFAQTAICVTSFCMPQRRPRSAHKGPKKTPTGKAQTRMVSSSGLALTAVTATTGAANIAKAM